MNLEFFHGVFFRENDHILRFQNSEVSLAIQMLKRAKASEERCGDPFLEPVGTFAGRQTCAWYLFNLTKIKHLPSAKSNIHPPAAMSVPKHSKGFPQKSKESFPFPSLGLPSWGLLHRRWHFVCFEMGIPVRRCKQFAQISFLRNAHQ